MTVPAIPVNETLGVIETPVVPKAMVLTDNWPVIPTPPLTVKAPVVVLVDAVPEVIATPDPNVLSPNIVCAAPEINPVDAFPASAT